LVRHGQLGLPFFFRDGRWRSRFDGG
jgi:hypothetical protein